MFPFPPKLIHVIESCILGQERNNYGEAAEVGDSTRGSPAPQRHPRQLESLKNFL